jgi:hypothetical protein
MLSKHRLFRKRVLRAFAKDRLKLALFLATG